VVKFAYDLRNDVTLVFTHKSYFFAANVRQSLVFVYISIHFSINYKTHHNAQRCAMLCVVFRCVEVGLLVLMRLKRVDSATDARPAHHFHSSSGAATVSSI